MHTSKKTRMHSGCDQQSRQGNIIVMSAAALVMVFAFTAFTVDVGYITLTKAELQKTSDASALGAVIELSDAFGPGKMVTAQQAETNARAAAAAVAAANRAGAGRQSLLTVIGMSGSANTVGTTPAERT